MRPAVLLLPLLLAACASGASPLGGYANYDALRVAREACLAKGQELVLKDQGDPQDITQWTCRRK